MPDGPIHVHYAAELCLPVGWNRALHQHDQDHELVLVVSGTMETTLGGRSWRSQPGQFKFHRAGTPHVEQSVGRLPLRLSMVSFSGPADGLSERGSDASGRLKLVLDWIAEIHPPATPAAQQALDALCRILLAHLRGEDGPSSLLAQQARRQLRANLNRPWSLAMLAAEAGLSRWHYAKRFHAETGISPMAFVRRERIAAARSLLVGSDLTLREIAARTGFADECQLSRVFRRVTGQSAGSARGRLASGSDS
jgi:AraC-like DNA-binding protein